MRTRTAHGTMAPPRSSSPISIITIAGVLLSFLAVAAAFMAAPAAAAPVAAADETAATCVPSLQRLLSCLDFIEHRTDEIPTPCCVQVTRTVAEQPCCLMHVVRGDAARLIGPEYDNTRAVVDVTAKCLGDASLLTSIIRNCSGKPLLPLTPEFTFTTNEVPPPSSSAAMYAGSSAWTSLFLGLVATVVYGAVAVLQI